MRFLPSQRKSEADVVPLKFEQNWWSKSWDIAQKARKKQGSSSAGILGELKKDNFYDTPTVDVMQVLLRRPLWTLNRPSGPLVTSILPQAASHRPQVTSLCPKWPKPPIDLLELSLTALSPQLTLFKPPVTSLMPQFLLQGLVNLGLREDNCHLKPQRNCMGVQD